jgi:HSP20 family protein
MKSLISKLALVGMLSVSLNATSLFHTTSDNDELLKMQSYFNNIMNQMMSDNFASMNVVYPKIDMQAKKDKYILKFELAGMDKNDIKLSINDDRILTIEGEKKTIKKDKNDSFMKQESFYGKFKRMIVLPKDANIDKIKSKFKNGILEVSIDKLKNKKPFYKSLKIN